MDKDMKIKKFLKKKRRFDKFQKVCFVIIWERC